MATGRNEPCPCDSGKKQKRCCLAAAPPAPVNSALQMKEELDRIHERLIEELFRHWSKQFDPAATVMDLAMGEFFGWPDDGSLGDEPLAGHEFLFFPWFIFKWRLEEGEQPNSVSGPKGISITESYLRSSKGKKLLPLEREYLTACAEVNFTFFEVIDVTPGQDLHLHDLLLDRKHLVQERSASNSLHQGEVLFGAVVEAGGITTMAALSSIPFLPAAKITVISARQKMLSADGGKITPETLYDFDLELRELYLELYKARISPPILYNTDDGKISFHTLKYTISSPQKVFEALKGLTGRYVSKKELLAEAEFDDQEQLIKVEIPWIKRGNAKNSGMENTLHGRVLIDGQKMSCEVNSAERAKRLRAIIEKKLPPEEARYRTTVIESTEAMMGKHQGQNDNGPSQEELMAMPEIRAHIEGMMRKHWQTWPDIGLPALQGRTPRQAAKDPLGRELVSALLEEAERQSRESDGAMGSPEIIAEVRQELGL